MTRIITSAMRDNHIIDAIETHTAKLVDKSLVRRESILNEQQRQKRREAQARREFREQTGQSWKGILK